MERGMTLTCENSSCAALGRSPPRRVMTSLTISPRLSRPDSDSPSATICESSGFDATTTLAPGVSFGSSARPNRRKNSLSSSNWSGVSVVKRGSGERLLPSKLGGMRQTPPLPFLSLACCSGVYSWRP